MAKFLAAISLTLAAAVNTGCSIGVGLFAGSARPATQEAMIVSQTPASAIAIPDQLRGQVAIEGVQGGKETNPMWMSNISSSAFKGALEASLRNAGLGAPNRDSGRYLLAAEIKNVERQPMIGSSTTSFSTTVTTTVQYDLTERATNRPAWAQTITRSYTAKAGDAFLGTERLRLANEGSARANIQGLIEELAKGVR